MRPVRFLLPVSTFLMRVGAAFYIYLMYFHYVLELNFQQFEFYFASLFSIFGVLLFFGAFTRKQSLTVLSALILFILGLYEMFTFTGGLLTVEFASNIFITIVALFFLCNGNKNR